VKLPIDTSAIAFLCALAPEPVVDFETKRPRADENGEPLYTVQLLVMGEDSADLIAVKVPGVPSAGIRQGAPVKVSGLVAQPWFQSSGRDRSGGVGGAYLSAIWRRWRADHTRTAERPPTTSSSSHTKNNVSGTGTWATSSPPSTPSITAAIPARITLGMMSSSRVAPAANSRRTSRHTSRKANCATPSQSTNSPVAPLLFG
jgi:hypothetical protein